jgi:hypothetical protein
MLKSKKDITLVHSITLPSGTIMEEEKWCNIIGRKGRIQPDSSSDSEWWEYYIPEDKFYIVVPKSDELEKSLLESGYEKRSGSASYNREFYLILPYKKYFWETDDKPKIEYTNYYDNI